ncbi:CHAT domain-containing protein [Coprinopsis sp. MPI-PUGE-AT-0042]|nr:CHAT domain-containing protein [Coprinopsis sp. MPI-PUGE-AT-0042]
MAESQTEQAVPPTSLHHGLNTALETIQSQLPHRLLHLGLSRLQNIFNQLQGQPLAVNLRIHASRRLVYGYLTRYTFCGWSEDMDECGLICGNLMKLEDDELNAAIPDEEIRAHGAEWAGLQEAERLMSEFCSSINTKAARLAINKYSKLIPYSTPIAGFVELHFGIATAHLMVHHHSADPCALDDAITLLQRVKDSVDVDHPLRFTSFIHLEHALRIHWVGGGPFIDFYNAMLASLSAGKEDEVARRSMTAGLNHWDKYLESCDLKSLEEAIRLLNTSVRLRPPGHANRAASLCNLGLVVLDRYKLHGDPSELEDAITLLREAVDLRPSPHPGRSCALTNLANALTSRYSLLGSQSDLDEAIIFQEETLELYPPGDPGRYNALNSLAVSIQKLYDQTGNKEDLERCIACYQEAIQTSPGNPDQHLVLTNLGLALHRRYALTMDTAILDESIEAHRQALVHVGAKPGRDAILNNLASELSTSFSDRGNPSHLDEAIALHREALRLTTLRHPERWRRLHNLSRALRSRYEAMGDGKDLREALALQRQVLVVVKPSDPDLGTALSSLALTLYNSFEGSGELSFLEESVSFLREAISLPHASSKPARREWLLNLATILQVLFESRGDIGSLNESFVRLLEAASICEEGSSIYAETLMSLSTTVLLMHKYRPESCGVTELKASIQLQREALDHLPSLHPSRLSYMNNLSISLKTLFGNLKEGDAAVIQESIDLARQVLELRLRKVEDVSAATSMCTLANSLLAQFDNAHSTSLEMLDESLSLFGEIHNNIGLAASARFELTRDAADLEMALSSFETAANSNSCPPFTRLHYARMWGSCADKHQPKTAINAYRCAVRVLPLMASLDLSLGRRHQVLVHSNNLARDAARAAIRVGDLEQAVVFFCTATSVLWSQLLKLRPNLEKLHSVDPALAQRFQYLALQLESAHSGRNEVSDASGVRGAGSSLFPRKLSQAMDHVLKKINALDGLDTFLKPTPFSQLQQAAVTRGPIVMLVCSNAGTDVLMMTASGVQHLCLPSFKAKEAQWMRGRILGNVPRGSSRSQRGARPVRQVDSQQVFVETLGRIWTAILLPVVSWLGLEKSDQPSRIWLLPSGPLASLPLHAAGIYEKDQSVLLSDYATISYCSSLEQLLRSYEPKTSARFLAVGQSEVPGRPELTLPATKPELDFLEQHFPFPEQLTRRLGNLNTHISKAEILGDLEKASFVHFGCHGLQDEKFTLSSHLQFSEQVTMQDLVRCNNPNAALAFLGACETTKGEIYQPDQAQHITAAMMFAGFKGVVGTMWSIMDSDALVVTEVFYRHLFRKGSSAPVDARDAAFALRLAVQELRKRGVRYSSWVPFVHYGI